MLTNGTIASMSPDERQLYLVLALAADRRGVSFYGDKRIGRILGCTPYELQLARHALMARALLAYDGATYQLLALPSDADSTPSAYCNPSPAASTPTNSTARTTPPLRTRTTTIDRQREHGTPESVRHILCGLLGRERF